jgi:hypothetical protein
LAGRAKPGEFSNIEGGPPIPQETGQPPGQQPPLIPQETGDKQRPQETGQPPGQQRPQETGQPPGQQPPPQTKQQRPPIKQPIKQETVKQKGLALIQSLGRRWFRQDDLALQRGSGGRGGGSNFDPIGGRGGRNGGRGGTSGQLNGNGTFQSARNPNGRGRGPSTGFYEGFHNPEYGQDSSGGISLQNQNEFLSNLRKPRGRGGRNGGRGGRNGNPNPTGNPTGNPTVTERNEDLNGGGGGRNQTDFDNGLTNAYQEAFGNLNPNPNAISNLNAKEAAASGAGQRNSAKRANIAYGKRKVSNNSNSVRPTSASRAGPSGASQRNKNFFAAASAAKPIVTQKNANKPQNATPNDTPTSGESAPIKKTEETKRNGTPALILGRKRTVLPPITPKQQTPSQAFKNQEQFIAVGEKNRATRSGSIVQIPSKKSTRKKKADNAEELATTATTATLAANLEALMTKLSPNIPILRFPISQISNEEAENESKAANVQKKQISDRVQTILRQISDRYKDAKTVLKQINPLALKRSTKVVPLKNKTPKQRNNESLRQLVERKKLHATITADLVTLNRLSQGYTRGYFYTLSSTNRRSELEGELSQVANLQNDLKNFLDNSKTFPGGSRPISRPQPKAFELQKSLETNEKPARNVVTPPRQVSPAKTPERLLAESNKPIPEGGLMNEGNMTLRGWSSNSNNN